MLKWLCGIQLLVSFHLVTISMSSEWNVNNVKGLIVEQRNGRDENGAKKASDSNLLGLGLYDLVMLHNSTREVLPSIVMLGNFTVIQSAMLLALGSLAAGTVAVAALGSKFRRQKFREDYANHLAHRKRYSTVVGGRSYFSLGRRYKRSNKGSLDSFRDLKLKHMKRSAERKNRQFEDFGDHDLPFFENFAAYDSPDVNSFQQTALHQEHVPYREQPHGGHVNIYGSDGYHIHPEFDPNVPRPPLPPHYGISPPTLYNDKRNVQNHRNQELQLPSHRAHPIDVKAVRSQSKPLAVSHPNRAQQFTKPGTFLGQNVATSLQSSLYSAKPLVKKEYLSNFHGLDRKVDSSKKNKVDGWYYPRNKHRLRFY